MDPSTSNFFLTKVEPSIAEHEEQPLDVGSWFTLYTGDGPLRTAIRCFEPKPKLAKDIKEGDVVLYQGNACRVLRTTRQRDAKGAVTIHVYDIFGEKTTVFTRTDLEEITMVVTRYTRYLMV